MTFGNTSTDGVIDFEDGIFAAYELAGDDQVLIEARHGSEDAVDGGR
jgi:hypothetical protein